MVKLEEKLLSQRLDLLFQRDLYQTALKLGSRSGFASHQINEIHFKYGEFLFSKGDFDAAMQQYVLAITAIEPSKVIRKVTRLPPSNVENGFAVNNLENSS